MNSEADVLLFPSMHEDAGWVVAEATSCGLPVAALDRGGPPTLGAAVATPGAVNETVARLAVCVTAVTSKERHPMSDFGLSTRFSRLEDLVLRRGILSGASATDIRP
jgi:glycosyltransferase involved in cell wall biosynthesis